MRSQTDIRRGITESIVQALEQGVVPWVRPWGVDGDGPPANVVSKRPYRGVNPLALEASRARHAFDGRWWGTYQQWSELGGVVRRRPDHLPPGEWGTRIIYYREVAHRSVDPATGEGDKYRFMRAYVVFNVDQVEGAHLDYLRPRPRQRPDAAAVERYDAAEELVKATGTDVRHGGGRACYVRPEPDGAWPNHRGGDYVCVPPPDSFATAARYYETLLHELSHWSEVRLGWDHVREGYAAGELVAEIAACFVAAEVGVPVSEQLDNHTAYLAHWLGQMRTDRSFIFRAAAQAQRVADYLMSFVPDRCPSSVAEGVTAA